jgi:hypothetical protein
MIRNLKAGEFDNMEGVVSFPLFDTDILIYIDEGVNIAYAEKCAEYLQMLPPPMVEKLGAGALEYCEEFCEYTAGGDWQIPENLTAKEILQYVQPLVLNVSVPDDENIMAFSLEFILASEKNGRAFFSAIFIRERRWTAERQVHKLICQFYRSAV